MSSSTRSGVSSAICLGRLHAVIGFADDLDIRVRAQQLLQPLARRLLVVDHQRPNHQTQTRPRPDRRLHHHHRDVVLILPRAAIRANRVEHARRRRRRPLRSRQPSSNVHQPLIAELLVRLVARLADAVGVGDEHGAGVQRDAVRSKGAGFDQAQAPDRWRRAHVHRPRQAPAPAGWPGVDEREPCDATRRARRRSPSRSARRRSSRSTSRSTAAINSSGSRCASVAAVLTRACTADATRPAATPLPDASPSSNRPRDRRTGLRPASGSETRRRNRRRRRAPAARRRRNRSPGSPAAIPATCAPAPRTPRQCRARRVCVASRARTRSSVAASLARDTGFSR